MLGTRVTISRCKYFCKSNSSARRTGEVVVCVIYIYSIYEYSLLIEASNHHFCVLKREGNRKFSTCFLIWLPILLVIILFGFLSCLWKQTQTHSL